MSRTKRRLILLTNEYPLARGDRAFVDNEIEALAENFDEVVVFNYPSPGPSETVTLPQGVRFGGTLKGGPRWRPLLGLLRPRDGWRFVSMVLRERRAGRWRGHERTELIAALASAKRGQYPGLRSLCVEPGWQTSIYAFWAAGAGLVLPSLPRVTGSVVIRLHGYDLYEEISGHLPLRASLFSTADVIMPISERGRDYLLDTYPALVNPNKVVVGRLGTQDHGVSRGERDETTLTVASCSSISPVKRVDRILDAVCVLGRDGPVRWVHLGGGPEEPDLRRRAASVHDVDIEIVGQVRHEEVIERYLREHVDVFVNSSSSEGVPVSIMEALSFDVPAVATDVGGTGELVNAALATGRLVSADASGNEIARAIRDVVDERASLSPRTAWRAMCDTTQTSRVVVDALTRSAGVIEGERSVESEPSRPTMLIVSFSPLAADARVLKQIRRFAPEYDVMTCGYGPAPDDRVRHLRIPDGVSTLRDGRFVHLRAYDQVEKRTPVSRYLRRALAGERFDVAIANDPEAVPVAFRCVPPGRVLADLHEYWPRLHEESPGWMRLIAPYYRWLMRRYASRAGAVTTVSEGLADEYRREFGFQCAVVTNAAPLVELVPGKTASPIRLVHSGACLRNRSLDLMIDAVLATTADVTLDLYLTPNHPEYLAEIQDRAGGSDRIVFHDPVPYSELVRTLNEYDVGIAFLPPHNFSLAWCLPNKFFDFVQARLAILTGPSPEMAQIAEGRGVGLVADDFTAAGLARVIDRLDVDSVQKMKSASNAAAHDLSAEAQVEVWANIVGSFFVKGAR